MNVSSSDTSTSTSTSIPPPISPPVTFTIPAALISNLTSISTITINILPPTTSATSAPVHGVRPNDQSKTGLIAGVAVLGGILTIALVAMPFLLLRNRRRVHGQTEDNPKAGSKNSSDNPGRDSKATVMGLEKTLEDRNSTIRQMQVAMLKRGDRSGNSYLDDVQIQDRFALLSNSVNDWVLMYFKDFHFVTALPTNVAETLITAVPQYEILIQQPRTKYLVVRAVVSQVLLGAFSGDKFFESIAYSELKRGIDADNSWFELREWEAMTIALSEKTADFQSGRASSIDHVARNIDDLTRGLSGFEYSKRRFAHLKMFVDTAADLAITLAKQPALYRLAGMHPETAYDPDTMEDALQDPSVEALKQREIKGTVFPAVRKWTNQQSSMLGSPLYIRKAQVIV